VSIDRGVMGLLPYAAIGSGAPVIVLSGLSPVTGVASDSLVRGALAPMRRLADRRRLIVLNRRAHLPAGTTMGELAAEHADAIRSQSGEPVDVVGMSTGGSIAQQLAADHPDVVRRLVLVSSACRLGPVGRDEQAAVAVELRAARTRRAMGAAASALVPSGLGTLARGLGWTMAPKVITGPQAAHDLATTIEAETFSIWRNARTRSGPKR
jgi:pimeloyl-ACP methyl ester carboxylesterase